MSYLKNQFKIRTRDIAYKALAENEAARNSDWVYLFEFLHQAGINIPQNIKMDIIHCGYNVNTIIRERQRIQNNLNLFPPIKDIKIKRHKLQKQYAENYVKEDI